MQYKGHSQQSRGRDVCCSECMQLLCQTSDFVSRLACFTLQFTNSAYLRCYASPVLVPRHLCCGIGHSPAVVVYGFRTSVRSAQPTAVKSQILTQMDIPISQNPVQIRHTPKQIEKIFCHCGSANMQYLISTRAMFLAGTTGSRVRRLEAIDFDACGSVPALVSALYK